MSESHTFWKHLSKEDVYCAIPAMTSRQYTWWYCLKDCPFKSPSPMKARVLLTFSNCNTHKIVGWLVYFFVYLVYWSIVVSDKIISNRICLSVYFFILLSICLSLWSLFFSLYVYSELTAIAKMMKDLATWYVKFQDEGTCI